MKTPELLFARILLLVHHPRTLEVTKPKMLATANYTVYSLAMQKNQNLQRPVQSSLCALFSPVRSSHSNDTPEGSKSAHPGVKASLPVIVSA
jgi:hypothetical protein